MMYGVWCAVVEVMCGASGLGDVRCWCIGEMMRAGMGKQCKVQGELPTYPQPGLELLIVNTEPEQGALGREIK